MAQRDREVSELLLSLVASAARATPSSPWGRRPAVGPFGRLVLNRDTPLDNPGSCESSSFLAGA